MKRLIEESKRMIRINSVTSRGNEELANYVEGLMRERGMKTQLQPVTHARDDFSKRQFNVIGVFGDPLVDRKIRKGLLLTSHLDTVSPGLPEQWTDTGGDPFAATVRDEKIFGLGSTSGKLSLLCMIHAAAKFREKKIKMPIYLAGTCGEEAGMFGAKYLIKSGALNPKYIAVGNPTGMKVVLGHKTYSLLKVSLSYQQVERDARGFNRRVDLYSYGKSAHGSDPSAGHNAVTELFSFLQRASDNGFDLRYTKFEGGNAPNQVPDRAFVQFYLTSHQFEDFKRFFRDIVKTEGREKTFRAELGGVGENGVKFLPEVAYDALQKIFIVMSKVDQDFKKVKDEEFSPSHSTVNVGRVMQSPGKIEAWFDLRVLPDLVLEDIEAHIKDEVQKIYPNHPIRF